MGVRLTLLCILTQLVSVAGTESAERIAPYLGQPVLSVDVEAPVDEDPEFLRQLIDIQPGYLLSTDDLQAAVKRLYALGRFSNVLVSAQRLSGVVLLTFRLRAIRRLESLDLEGVSDLDVDELRTRLAIRPGDEISASILRQLEERAKEHLTEVGYPRAHVAVHERVPKDGSPVRPVTLFVLKGAPEQVSSLRFVGDPRVGSHILSQVIETRVGGVLDRRQLERDREALSKAYLERGFLRAQVSPPLITKTAAGHAVQIPIDAGDQIAVALTGNHVVGDTVLFALWPAEDRRVDNDRLHRFAHTIREHYVRLGHADANVRVRGFRDRPGRITRYLLEIKEGPLVSVRKIRFPGASAISSHTLGEQVRAVLAEGLANTSSSITQFLLEAQGERSDWGRADFQPSFESPIPPEERWVPELYEKAVDGIRAVYQDRGYLDAKLSEPLLQRQGDDAEVIVQVEEGAQSTLGSLRFQDNQAMAAHECLTMIEAVRGTSGTKVTLGRAYTSSGIEEGRITMLRRYRDLGYLYAKVFADSLLRDDRRTVDVTYRVEEGPQVRLRSVLVHGNRNTNTDTIVDRMELGPGDLYRLEQALADRRAIARLGIFDNVGVRLIDEPRPEERKDLVVEVSERERQALGLLFGFSTADGLRLGGSYTHINVFGNATEVSVDAKFNMQFLFELYGDRQQALRERYDAYFRNDPLFKALERDLRAGIRSRRLGLIPPLALALRADLTNERDNTVAYSLDETALTVGAELFPTDSMTLALEPQIAFTALECPQTEGTNDECVRAVQTDRRQPIEEGERFTFKIGPSVTVDRRDNRLNPSAGVWFNGRAQWAFGTARTDGQEPFAPFSFAKFEGALIGYIPIFGPILVLTARAGHLVVISGEGVPIDERFFLGGRDTLRGFVENTLVPEDACLNRPSDPLCEAYPATDGGPITRGGNTYILLRSELRVPITESVSIAVFVDVGNLWAGAPRAETLVPRVGFGAGLRWETAVGALIADLGINPAIRLGESNVEPHFSVSNF